MGVGDLILLSELGNSGRFAKEIIVLSVLRPQTPELESVAAGAEALCSRYPWYALHVRSKFEHLVSVTLRGKGYQEFLPLYRSRRRWSDRVKEIDLPLFPGYLFCRFDVRDRLLPILSTPGVIAIVAAGKTPVPVSEEEIAVVQAVVRSGLPTLPWPCLTIGDESATTAPTTRLRSTKPGQSRFRAGACPRKLRSPTASVLCRFRPQGLRSAHGSRWRSTSPLAH